MFDSKCWLLHSPQGQSITVSLAEFLLLRQLFASPGMVVPRQTLLEGLDRGHVHAHDDSRVLDMIVSRLRKKVRAAQSEPIPLQAARGVGYVFAGRGQVI